MSNCKAQDTAYRRQQLYTWTAPVWGATDGPYLPLSGARRWSLAGTGALSLASYASPVLVHSYQWAHLKPAASLVHSSSTKEGLDTFTTSEMFQLQTIHKTWVPTSEQWNHRTRDHGQRTCLQKPLKPSRFSFQQIYWAPFWQSIVKTGRKNLHLFLIIIVMHPYNTKTLVEIPKSCSRNINVGYWINRKFW